jgi:peptidoglycan hydrolase-like protein with peptidoglycan-binding domain
MSELHEAHPRGSVLRWVALGVAILLVGAVVGWATSTVFTPPKDVLDSTAFTYVELVEGEVGSSITLNTLAEWKAEPIGTNLASGTVTTVGVVAGATVDVGSTLYTVNLRPVVVAQGEIPAFRTLARGDTGADVTQLQNMLRALGFLRSTADGLFGSATENAVRAWQRDIGADRSGVVEAGDIVFVPHLPTRISLDTSVIKRGATLSGGEEVIAGLPLSPEFTVPVSESQAALMPAGTRVDISGPDNAQWVASVVGRETADDGTISMTLESLDDAPICAEECGSLSVAEPALLLSRVETVSVVRGLTVPSAALLSKADGTVVVIDAEGTEYSVTVVTSARGMSIIEGAGSASSIVESGLAVRVPAKED